MPLRAARRAAKPSLIATGEVRKFFAQAGRIIGIIGHRVIGSSVPVIGHRCQVIGARLNNLNNFGG